MTYVHPPSGAEWPDSGLHEAALGLAEDHGIAFVFLEDNQTYPAWIHDVGEEPWCDTAEDKGPPLAVLWGCRRLRPGCLLSWENALVEAPGVPDWRILRVDHERSGSEWRRWLEDALRPWLRDEPAAEGGGGLTVGGLADLSDPPDDDEVDDRAIRSAGAKAGYEPSFLLAPPDGRLAGVVGRLNHCKRRYRAAIGRKVGDQREAEQAAIRAGLAYDGTRRPSADKLRRLCDGIGEAQRTPVAGRGEGFGEVDRTRLPRILLLGESGTGKMLLYRYLALRTSPGPDDRGEELYRPHIRIAIPGYLGDEEAFEYDVFGYVHGAFNNAVPGGSLGLLLTNMGGVVFFDEIGDANARIQAKLLAYLDDYDVVPRGWLGRQPIYCPMHVVAATNRPVDRWARDETRHPRTGEHLFRRDLLNRFDVVVRVPSLNERTDELRHLVDVLLQLDNRSREGVGHALAPQPISSVSEDALCWLQTRDYENANFRLLRRLLQDGARRARLQQRDRLTLQDLLAAPDPPPRRPRGSDVRPPSKPHPAAGVPIS